MQHSFHYKNSRFNYYLFGSGKFPLIAFHGFGQNGQMFAPVKESFGHKYTIYSVDFAYHGKTEWKEEVACTKAETIALLKEFMQQQGFEKISLMGFSMGGRIVMSLIADMAPVLNEVFLLSPDGISERVYYRDVLANRFGDAAFKQMLKHPEILINATQLFSKIGLTKKYVADYVKSYLGEERRRNRIYNIWLSMQTFRTNLTRVRSASEKNHLKVYLLWGKRDKVLPVEYAHRFKKAVPQCELILLDGGHFIVDERLNPVINQLLH
ncbi:MAG: alpha/beta hydrolase [Chitinophagales bacterium]|nr:alpha/beta hydrolase [Chitinophagales bacterium]